jgi:serine/threonine protein kinase
VATELSGLLARRFEVLSKAGEGGMGEVYRVRDWASDRVVALKVLSDTAAHQQDRFERERKLLAELEHPAIVRFIAHGKLDDGRPYLAMEWLEGESLSERLERELLTVGETLELAEQVADAMGAAHEAGIVHRDLKPANIFLIDRALGRIKLLDFGIASARGSHKELTESTTMLGTPGYMAPEQMQSSKQASAAADVFSLGCVMFKCLTGTIPFEGRNTLDLVLSVMTRPPLPILTLRQDATRPLEQLLAKLLEKLPADRPANGSAAAGLIAEVRRARDSQTPDSYRPPCASSPAHATLVTRNTSRKD